MTRHIDMTPTWTEAARMIAAIVRNGTSTGRDHVIPEILRMGEIIDRLTTENAELTAKLEART